MKWRRAWIVPLTCTVGVIVGFWAYSHSVREVAENTVADIDNLLGNDQDVIPPRPLPASSQEVRLQPKDLLF